MMPRVSDLNGHNGSYFDRAPERLVLEGYRHALAAHETGSLAPWELGVSLYENLLGLEEGGRAMADLSLFMRALRRCANCQLRSFPFGAQHICRDECLALGLIANLQHGDEDTARICVGAMACPLRCGEVAKAAQPLVETLTRLDHRLLPIPRHVIANIILRSSRGTVH